MRVQVSYGEIEGLWRSARSPEREISLVLAPGGKGFLTIVEMDEEAYVEFQWTYAAGEIGLVGDVWFSLQRSAGKLILTFEDGSTESLFATAEPEEFGEEWRHKEAANWRRWAWTVQRPQRKDSVTEAAMVEMPLVIVGSYLCSQPLASSLPQAKGFMLLIAFSPAILVLVFREFYSNAPSWWRLCPEVRRFAAVIYFALACLATVMFASKAWFALSPPDAIARSIVYGAVVLGCGWTLLRELRGEAGLRFEGLDR